MWDNFHKKKKQRTVWEPKRENGMWTDSGRMTSLPERGGGAKDFAYHFKWIVSLQQDSHCCPLWCVSNVLNTFAQRGHFTPLAVVTSQTWLTGIFQPNASGLGQVSKDSSLSATASAYSYVCRQKTGLLLGMSSVWTRSKTWRRWNELTLLYGITRGRTCSPLSTFWGSVNTNHCFAGRCCWRLCGYSFSKTTKRVWLLLFIQHWERQSWVLQERGRKAYSTHKLDRFHCLGCYYCPQINLLIARWVIP